MSAVPTPRLDRAVMRALEVRAMECADLAYYLGVDLETLDLALMRLKGRLVRQGKLLALPLARRPERPDFTHAMPLAAVPGSARRLGSTQRKVLSALEPGRRYGITELTSIVGDAETQDVRHSLDALLRRELVARECVRKDAQGRPVWRWWALEVKEDERDL